MPSEHAAQWRGDNPHIGSSFDDFLDKEGIATDVTEQAMREIIHNLAQDGLTPAKITVALACRLFAEKALGLSKAARLAGLSPQSFIEKLGAMGIAAVDYDPAELDSELAHLQP